MPRSVHFLPLSSRETVILGLTGSIGSGKSTVSRMLEELAGAVVIDADAIAHQVQAPGGSAYADIVAAFGSHILNADSTINRQKLAEEVFGDESKRRQLNSIIHPRVRDEELRLLAQFRERPLVVLMVPLLLENRMQNLVDRVVVVTVSGDERRKRLFHRSGMTSQEVDRRLSAQMPEAEKVRLADIVIDNSGTPAETFQQVRDALTALNVPVLPGR